MFYVLRKEKTFLQCRHDSYDGDGEVDKKQKTTHSADNNKTVFLTFEEDRAKTKHTLSLLFSSSFDRVLTPFLKSHETMEENTPSEILLGSKGLIKKHEFIRIILQSLYSLGYTKTASLLESESGVSYKSNEFQLLESHVLNGNWEACVTFLNSIAEILGESVQSALFLVFRQSVMEYLKRGEDGLALDVLRKRVSALRVDRFKVHSLANSVVNLNDEVVEGDLRDKLLMDLEKLLPPPISIPDGRLERLVETTVTAWVDKCLYHSSSNPVSLYEDHCCGRDQFPTTTTQVCGLLLFSR